MYTFILNSVYWISRCPYAHQILPNLLAPHETLSRPGLRCVWPWKQAVLSSDSKFFWVFRRARYRILNKKEILRHWTCSLSITGIISVKVPHKLGPRTTCFWLPVFFEFSAVYCAYRVLNHCVYPNSRFGTVLSAFEKQLTKAAICFVVPVRPSIWNSTTPGRIS